MHATYRALEILDFDTELLKSITDEMAFMQEMGHAGKISQGIFIARKT